MTDRPPPEISVKFASLLASVEPLVKDRTAKAGSYEYAYTDINAVLHMLKPLAAEHGLAISQPIVVRPDNGQNLMIVQTMFIDIKSGESFVFDGPGFPVKGDPQAAGTAITYMRRYALVSLFGLEQHDDDGAQAHRAEVSPTNRTGAETEIRTLIAAMEDDDERNQFIADFKVEFGCTLRELPESRHGDALGWVRAQLTPVIKDDVADEGGAS